MLGNINLLPGNMRVHVFPVTHFVTFPLVLCVHSLHSSLCNCRGALCTWVGLLPPRHSVSCIMPCLPPEYNPKEHALEVVEAAKLKVGKPLLVQKRQSRGGVYLSTISKVPSFFALLMLGLHFFLRAFLSALPSAAMPRKRNQQMSGFPFVFLVTSPRSHFPRVSR